MIGKFGQTEGAGIGQLARRLGRRTDALGGNGKPVIRVHTAGSVGGSTAIVAANDLLAIGLLQGLVTAGLRVPEDVAIIGYDDIDFATAAAVSK